MKVLSVIGALIALALFLAGCAGLIRPAAVRLRRRRHALALAGFAFVVMGFAVDLDPAPGHETERTGPAVLTTWILCVIMAWGVMHVVRAMRAQRAIGGTDKAPAELQPPSPASTSAQPFWADRPASRTGASSPSQSPAAKGRAINRAPRAAPKPPARASIWTPDDSGSSASFTYVDSDGVVTDRTITNWQSDGRYIRGFCLDRRAHRTFLKDRIEDWLDRSNSAG